MIRRGSQADIAFMRSMLAHAYAWRVNQFETQRPLSRYVENWGRPGDLALVATESGHPVGAAWLRVFDGGPELTIAVVPSRRRHGVGQELLDALIEKARAAGHAEVSLEVESDSDAVRFYERNGFERVRDADGALVMRRTLEPGSS